MFIFSASNAISLPHFIYLEKEKIVFISRPPNSLYLHYFSSPLFSRKIKQCQVAFSNCITVVLCSSQLQPGPRISPTSCLRFADPAYSALTPSSSATFWAFYKQIHVPPKLRQTQNILLPLMLPSKEKIFKDPKAQQIFLLEIRKNINI